MSLSGIGPFMLLICAAADGIVTVPSTRRWAL
jgi:hypothetical protein